MPNADRLCMNCRYWSQMVARAGGGTDNSSGDTEALCLAPQGSPLKDVYTIGPQSCVAFAYNTAGSVDEPPDFGENARAIYADQATAKYPNGAAMFAPDGTMIDDHGNRSIFDDVDE
jgi:hypothetical protein